LVNTGKKNIAIHLVNIKKHKMSKIKHFKKMKIQNIERKDMFNLCIDFWKQEAFNKF